MSWVTVAHAGVILAFGLLAVVVGGVVVTWVFKHVARHMAAHNPDGTPAAEQGIIAARRTLKGGSWIGMLERLAIFAGVVAHYPEAIAIALAIKGLARYPELSATSPGAAERFIIGTFASVLFACGCAGLAWWVNGFIT